MWVLRPAGTPSVAVWPMLRVGPGWSFCAGAKVTPPAGKWTQLTVAVPSPTAQCIGASASAKLAVDAICLQVYGNRAAAQGKKIYLSDVTW